MHAEKTGIYTQEISRKTLSTIVTLHPLLSGSSRGPRWDQQKVGCKDRYGMTSCGNIYAKYNEAAA